MRQCSGRGLEGWMGGVDRKETELGRRMGEEEKKEDGQESRTTVGEMKEREREREFLSEGGLREWYIAAGDDCHLNNQTVS